VDVGTGAVRKTPGSPGGLIPIMLSLLEEVGGGHWIYTAPAGDSLIRSERGGRISLSPLSFDEQLATKHYEMISIRVLLWLFHYIFDTAYEPSFNSASKAHWSGYEAVNRRFADEIALAHQNSPDEVVFVHDAPAFLMFQLIVASGLKALCG
jgi:trehalose 6-phosphate synthase